MPVTKSSMSYIVAIAVNSITAPFVNITLNCFFLASPLEPLIWSMCSIDMYSVFPRSIVDQMLQLYIRNIVIGVADIIVSILGNNE